MIEADDVELLYRAIKSCTGSFFSRNLPGGLMLLEDFVEAAEKIAASPDLDDRCPRVEAQATISSIIFISSENCLRTSDERQVARFTAVKTRIADFIITSCRKDPAGQARCVAFR